MRHFALLIAAALLMLAPQALRAHAVLLLIAIAGSLLIWFEPFFGRKLWMIVTAITLGVCVSAFDGPDSDSSGDDGDSGGGYDGTGTTIHYDV